MYRFMLYKEAVRGICSGKLLTRPNGIPEKKKGRRKGRSMMQGILILRWNWHGMLWNESSTIEERGGDLTSGSTVFPV